MKLTSEYEKLFALGLEEKQARRLIIELQQEFPESKLPKKLLNHYGFSRKNKSKLWHPKKIHNDKGEVIFDPTKYWVARSECYTISPKIGDRVRVMASGWDLKSGTGQFYTGVVVDIGSYRGKKRFYIRPDLRNHKVVVRFQTKIEL
jgi:hypothetical protein